MEEDSCEMLRLPFPYKMWIIINMEVCQFIRWSRDGTEVVLELSGLDDYLATPLSIFMIKNRSEFVEHMVQFGFERQPEKPEKCSKEVQLRFKHESFQRHRLDLVGNISCKNPKQLNLYADYGNSKDTWLEEDITHLEARMLLLRLRGDPCFSYQGAVPHLQRLRMILQTTTSFQAQKAHLAEQVEQSYQMSDEKKRLLKIDMGGRQRSNANSIASNVMLVNSLLHVDNYVNPQDSHFLTPAIAESSEKDELLLGNSRAEYAGYYGDCNRKQLAKFFGEYLPTFEEGTVTVKKFQNPLDVDISDDLTKQDIGPLRSICEELVAILNPRLLMTGSELQVSTISFASSKNPKNFQVIMPKEDESESESLECEPEGKCRPYLLVPLPPIESLDKMNKKELERSFRDGKAVKFMESLKASLVDTCLLAKSDVDEEDMEAEEEPDVPINAKNSLKSINSLIKSPSKSSSSTNNRRSANSGNSKSAHLPTMKKVDFKKETISMERKVRFERKQSEEETLLPDDDVHSVEQFTAPLDESVEESTAPKVLDERSDDHPPSNVNLPELNRELMEQEVEDLRKFCRQYRSSLDAVYDLF